MSFDAHQNFAFGHVAIAPTPADSGLSLVLVTNDALKFPATPFNATVYPINTRPNTTNAEIVRVTNITGDVLTIVRAQESTGSRTILAGDEFSATITKKTLTDIEASVAGFITPGAAFTGSLVFGTSASKVVPGATSLAFRNNADSANNLLISDAGLVTVRNGLNVAAGGAIVAAGDLSVTAGRLIFGATASKIVPGATSLSIRNNADTATNVLISDVGSVTITGADGSGSGVVGTGHVINTGAGGGGNARGGDVVFNLGLGTGTSRAGQVRINGTVTNPESDVTPALLVLQTYTPGAAGHSVQAAQLQLTTSGDGSLCTGPSVSGVELIHDWQATGIMGSAIIYAIEGQMFISSDGGTVGLATSVQGNIRGTGTTVLTSGMAFRASIGAFTGNVTTMRGYGIAYTPGTGIITNLTGYDSAGIVKSTSTALDTTGGYNITGGLFALPSQGGNTSGTNTNRGIRVSATAAGAGGGTAGNGGTVNNISADIALGSAAALGSGTGHTRNIGLQITGNGGSLNGLAQGATGGVSNWAVYCSSTAQWGIAGQVSIGAGIGSTDAAYAANSYLIITPTSTAVSASGTVWAGVSVPAATLTVTGGVSITTANGVNLINIAAPTITSPDATTIAKASTLALGGPPIAGGSVTLTATYVFDVQSGNIRFGAGVNISLDTVTGTKIGIIGGASGGKLGFFNATPIVQPLLATGAGATADNIITALQNLGLVRQS